MAEQRKSLQDMSDAERDALFAELAALTRPAPFTQPSSGHRAPVHAGAAVSTVTNVELVAVGSWDACTPHGGKFVVSQDDLRQAIAAIESGDARPPVVKLGHESPLNDGAPAFGKVTNLRLSDDGMTLVGDLAGVPAWLADIMASAYPKRSIEGFQDYTSDTGRSYGLVLTAVALLGEAYPAVETLEDIRAAYQTEAPPLIKSSAAPVVATNTIGGRRMPEATKVAASATYDQVWTAFSQEMPWSYWVRELYVDPMEIIANDDDTGHTMRVPYSVDADGNVTFGDPVRVAVEYRDVSATTAAASSRLLTGAGAKTFATAAEYRKVAATSPDGADKEEAVENTDPRVLQLLGLTEDATQEQYDEALTQHLAGIADAKADDAGIVDDDAGTADKAPEGDLVAAGAKIPDGTILVSAAVHDQQAKFMAAAMRREEKDALDQAIREKRITAAERPKLEQRFQIEGMRESTLELLTGDDAAVKAGRALPPGTVGTLTYAGHAGDGEAESDTPSPERVAAKASFLLGNTKTGGR